MTRGIILTLFILFIATSANANDEFEQYKKSEMEAFKSYTKEMEREWNNYLADIKNNFGVVELSSNKKRVDYSRDKKAKVAMDYDKGTISIEFVAGKDDKDKAMETVSKFIEEKSKDINPFSKAPTLLENVDIDKLDLKKAEAVGGPSKNVYKLTIPLNDYRQENNEIQIADHVRDMALKYKVSYDLVMAIIKAETNFNIGAKSKNEELDIRNPDLYQNNPWGLMQVVPNRIGKEGWARAKGEDRIPGADELLDPRTNLEIGVAYLSLLQNNYFDGVRDEKSRESIMIYAYRENPQKTYRIFSKNGKKIEAEDQINKLQQEELINWLSGKTKKNSLESASGRHVKDVEKERDNYRVANSELENLKNLANKIIGNPELLETIKEWLGTPYLYGSNSKNAIDCSAFTMNVYSETYKLRIPRTSNQQYSDYGRTSVKKLDREEGDLVYFKTIYNGKPVSHVGIWLKDNYFVHASSSKGVVISSFAKTSYWRNKYVGANRPPKNI